MHSYTEMKRLIEEDPSAARGVDFVLPTGGPEPTAPYPHQIEAVHALTLREMSGIVHLPTGAGKTRVALTWMAAQLERDRTHRIVWASYPRVLIQQAMARMVDLGRVFPGGTRFTWVETEQAFRKAAHFNRFHVTFAMREHLTDLFNVAADGRVSDALTEYLEASPAHRVTIVYDECHQLGARELQAAIRKFFKKHGPSDVANRVRFIGLSATPLPTGEQPRRLLQEKLFPITYATRAPEWNLMVHARVSNEELIQKKVLCRVNTYWQSTGRFDVPASLLKQVIDRQHLSAPPRDGDRVALERYAKQFNSRVMGSNEIVDFLATRVGDHLVELGKTLVFAPTIDAARRFVYVLSQHPRVGRGRVSLVHSRLDDEDEGLVADRDNPRTIVAFKARGSEPCVLVNVGMLTTGFDDPAIRTVVLARLTFSTNLFWQMIGRGTRGPATGGTPDCYVIDPVRLTQLYGYAEYQPRLSERGYSARDWDDDAARGADAESALPPQLPSINVPPPPSRIQPFVDPELERIRPDVARAVVAFLLGQSESGGTAAVMLGTRVTVASDGGVHIGANAGAPDEATASYFLAERVARMEARHPTASFAWVYLLVQGAMTQESVTLLAKQLDRIEERGITSHEDWLRYMSTLF